MDPKHEELLKELYLEMYDNMLSYAIVAFKDEIEKFKNSNKHYITK